VRPAEFGRRGAAGLRQAAKRSVTAFGAFEYFNGDMPPRVMQLASGCENFTGPIEGDLHVGKGSLVITFCNHHGHLPSTFRGPAALGEKQSLQVSRISENARALHRLGSLWTGFHLARLLQRDLRGGIEVQFGTRVFPCLIHGHLD
jgi:hypothetical protein